MWILLLHQVVGAVLNADSVNTTAPWGVVRAVLNGDSVDTTAGNKLWEQY